MSAVKYRSAKSGFSSLMSASHTARDLAAWCRPKVVWPLSLLKLSGGRLVLYGEGLGSGFWRQLVQTDPSPEKSKQRLSRALDLTKQAMRESTGLARFAHRKLFEAKLMIELKLRGKDDIP